MQTTGKTSGYTPARSSQIELILRQIESLPTLMPVAMRLMRIGNLDDADLDQIVQVIESDPPMTARLLGMCRRAEKGLGDRVTTLRRAVVMLGLEAVQAAALSVAVFEVMQACAPGLEEQTAEDGGPESPGRAWCHGFDRPGFWRHCIAVAAASERLAELHPALGVRPEEAFVGGLLHDIGKLVLHIVLPQSYGRVLGLAERRYCASGEIENQILGIDHHSAGRRLAEYWGLASMYQHVIWLHGQTADGIPDTPHRHLIALVGVARVLCRHLHLGWCGDFDHPEPLDGRHGICARLCGAEDLLDGAALQACASGLHESVRVRCHALGLDEQTTPDMLLASLATANRRLGRMTVDLRARSQACRQQEAALAAIDELNADDCVPPGIYEVLARVARSAMKALGPGTCVTLHQARPGEAWHVSQYGLDTAPRTHVLEMEECDGSYPSLDDFVRSGGWEALHALPALQKRVPDARSLHVHALHDVRDEAGHGAAAFLLHSAEPLRDPCSMGALRSSWSAAFSAAARHEAARRLSEQLACANRALVQTETHLAEAQSMARLGEMAAGAAHEMNNPLAVISGRAELLAQHASSDADRRSAGLIVDAANRLSDLITAMHGIATPTLPRPRAIRLCDVIERAVEAARSKAGHVGHVEIELEDQRAIVEVDPDQAAAALLEVIANGLLASPRGNVRVRAHIAPSDGRLIVSVTDDGAGMTLRAQQHAFDAFFSERPAGRGTGLGLTRARSLVELSKGRIVLECPPEGGTRATVEFPQAGRGADSASASDNSSLKAA